MFDIAFSELIVVSVVALIVIGPERLPKVARTIGHLLGRLQCYVGGVKADISRELQLDELKKLQAEMQASAQGVANSISSEIQAVEQQVGDAAQAVKSAIQEVPGGGVPTAQGVGTSSAVIVDRLASKTIVPSHNG